MIEAALGLLVLGGVVFVVGVRLGIMLGTRLDRAVARHLDPDGAAAGAVDPVAVGDPNGPPIDGETVRGVDEASRS